LKVIAAEGCGVEVGPAGSAAAGDVAGGLIPGMFSSDKEQELSNSTNRLTKEGSLRAEKLTL
jgi:hypothetical protein